MELCKEARQILDAAREAGLPPVWSLEPRAARERLRKMFTSAPRADEPVEVSDRTLPSWILATPMYRRYAPATTRSDLVVLFFHGGGWVVNSVETHDNLCRRLAASASCEVLSLEYPLAPEHPYPAAIHAAAQWICHLRQSGALDSRKKVVVGGDSSGASIALCLSQSICLGGELAGCISLYPAVAHYTRDFPSYSDRARGYNLTAEWMRWFWDFYIHPNQVRTALSKDPALEPLYGTYTPNVAHFLLTAEYDPLRDEGFALADHLKTNGCKVTHSHYADQMHGFIMVPHLIPSGFSAIGEVAEFLATL